MAALPRCVHLDAVVSAAHERVFAELLAVNEASKLHATLRVAGGWVRDHILGIPSSDIDIAIESPPPPQPPVTGEQFAREVARHAALRTGRTRTVGVIRVNPALSKHIETATVCVEDIPVEFCALRSDDYSAHSRIPRVRAATPREDALRRDFTINALFYNLHTRLVEDYTTGLADLQPPQRVLRCPLNAAVTLMDDPLRLLRGIRFVGQLGAFDVCLDPTVLQCVDAALLDALQRKVSRERVGKEVAKMFVQPYADACVRLLVSTQLLQRVVLAEVYVSPTRAKKQSGADVDRVDYMVDKVASADVALRQVVWLTTHLLADIARTSSTATTPTTTTTTTTGEEHTATTKTAASTLSADEQLTSVLFAVVLPFVRDSAPRSTTTTTTTTTTRACDDVDDRLYALCVHGLKLPLRVCHVLRRMVACYRILQRHGFDAHTQLQGSSLCSSTRLTLFDALGALHDRQVPASAFRVVLFAYYHLEDEAAWSVAAAAAATAAVVPHRAQRDAAVCASAAFARVWAHVECDESLRGAHTRTLPLRGDELRTLLGVPASEIGGVLCAVRRQLLLHPCMTRDEVVTWLRTTQLQQQQQQQP